MREGVLQVNLHLKLLGLQIWNHGDGLRPQQPSEDGGLERKDPVP